MIRIGDVIPLTIEKPAAGGRMIARHEGQVILVSGAIPGERVRARVERVGKGVGYAQTAEVDEPSADRRALASDPLCGGCLYAHVAYPRQLDLKARVIADAFARIAHVGLPDAVRVAASPEEGYRMRARLHVRGSAAGFFREGTHDICEPRQTRQLLAATCDVLDRLLSAIRSHALDAVREIDLAENADASDRVVALESASPMAAPWLDDVAALEGITGVVFGSGVRGDAHVTDSVDLAGASPIRLRRHVLAFFQGNRFLLRDLAAAVVDRIGDAAEVVDLYAGGGLFSLAAASRGARVTAVEGDRTAAADLIANAASGGVTPVHQSVEAFLAAPAAGGAGLPPDTRRVVVVDPPRTGLSKEAAAGVVALRPRRVVYVSCDVATLARDARALVDAGYGVARADGFDLFPNTPHVETVVVFER